MFSSVRSLFGAARKEELPTTGTSRAPLVALAQTSTEDTPPPPPPQRNPDPAKVSITTRISTHGNSASNIHRRQGSSSSSSTASSLRSSQNPFRIPTVAALPPTIVGSPRFDPPLRSSSAAFSKHLRISEAAHPLGRALSRPSSIASMASNSSSRSSKPASKPRTSSQASISKSSIRRPSFSERLKARSSSSRLAEATESSFSTNKGGQYQSSKARQSSSSIRSASSAPTDDRHLSSEVHDARTSTPFPTLHSGVTSSNSTHEFQVGSAASRLSNTATASLKRRSCAEDNEFLGTPGSSRSDASSCACQQAAGSDFESDDDREVAETLSPVEIIDAPFSHHLRSNGEPSDPDEGDVASISPSEEEGRKPRLSKDSLYDYDDDEGSIESSRFHHEVDTASTSDAEGLRSSRHTPNRIRAPSLVSEEISSSTSHGRASLLPLTEQDLSFVVDDDWMEGESLDLSVTNAFDRGEGESLGDDGKKCGTEVKNIETERSEELLGALVKRYSCVASDASSGADTIDLGLPANRMDPDLGGDFDESLEMPFDTSTTDSPAVSSSTSFSPSSSVDGSTAPFSLETSKSRLRDASVSSRKSASTYFTSPPSGVREASGIDFPPSSPPTLSSSAKGKGRAVSPFEGSQGMFIEGGADDKMLEDDAAGQSSSTQERTSLDVEKRAMTPSGVVAIANHLDGNPSSFGASATLSSDSHIFSISVSPEAAATSTSRSSKGRTRRVLASSGEPHRRAVLSSTSTSIPSTSASASIVSAENERPRRQKAVYAQPTLASETNVNARTSSSSAAHPDPINDRVLEEVSSLSKQDWALWAIPFADEAENGPQWAQWLGAGEDELVFRAQLAYNLDEARRLVQTSWEDHPGQMTRRRVVRTSIVQPQSAARPPGVPALTTVWTKLWHEYWYEGCCSTPKKDFGPIIGMSACCVGQALGVNKLVDGRRVPATIEADFVCWKCGAVLSAGRAHRHVRDSMASERKALDDSIAAGLPAPPVRHELGTFIIFAAPPVRSERMMQNLVSTALRASVEEWRAKGNGSKLVVAALRGLCDALDLPRNGIKAVLNERIKTKVESMDWEDPDDD